MKATRLWVAFNFAQKIYGKFVHFTGLHCTTKVV